ncbi:telomerase protein component 1-like isoform X1 [Channa argus]|uniref:telomerase protein component 1-like isoform X1 n=1 Tax=Channa argus TaxID=215402 RepID=UPI0035200195
MQHADMAQGEQQHQQRQDMCWRRFSSSCTPPNLDNRFLSQTSTLMTQPPSPLIQLAVQPSSSSSLQPTSLSSTSSSLLSTTSSHSLTSPLLSTQNKLLKQNPPHLCFSWTSSIPKDSLLSTSLASSALHGHHARSPSFLHHGLSGEQKRDDGGDKSREEMSELMQSSFEDTSVLYSGEEDVLSEEERKVEDAGSTIELPVLETASANHERQPTMIVRQEEFAKFDNAKEKIEEKLKDKKYLLLNAVCCSLVNKITVPGQQDWDSENSLWTRITNLAKDISVSDPEFLLKVAIYARQELDACITANFLLALAASQPATKPHVRRYYCAAVQLPSDWLEVARIYSTCFSCSLPTCLKKAMADKFKQFSEHQLAKYNTRKQQCEYSRKSKKPNKQQLKQWADLIRADDSVVKNFMQIKDGNVGVDEKSDFTMKKMIKRLHIKEPAEHVMAILGQKYPADLTAFNHSGMKGVWDKERAGQRMMLKEPETWEHLLSRKGNNAATWEKIIDNECLPFMAMLRNLRNIISMGISETHHNKILSRLANKKEVIESRQFPFTFLMAYKVIMELQTLTSTSQQALPTVKDILKGILKKIPKSRRFSRVFWEKTKPRRIRATLGVPFIYRLYKMKKAQMLKADRRLYTVDLLDRYRKALETAVQISCDYNVPPLPGRTIIVFYRIKMPLDPKPKFYLPPDQTTQGNNQEDKEEKRQKRRGWTKKEEEDTMKLPVLLSLMIGSSAEDCHMFLHNWKRMEEIKLTSDVLLENVRSVMKRVKVHIQKKKYSYVDHSKTFFRLLTEKNKVDNIILVTNACMFISQDVRWAVETYVNKINNQTLVMHLYMNDWDNFPDPNPTDRNCVKLTEFSEQMLRVVAARGSPRLLDHVEHLDKVYNIPPPVSAKDRPTLDDVIPIPSSPKLRWQCVRVFISSTFGDMYAERDVLARSVFPELRRRAASHCLYLQEVELRWGLTEVELDRATNLCLSEVCSSQMMVGILGERYGPELPKPFLPDLPQYSWLASAPPGLSITEMEIRQFQALYPDTARQRMFCYFRDPNITKSVPVAWKSEFVPESQDAASKMASLKSRIWASDVKVTENYPCEWGHVLDGKPYLKNLDDFGKAVLEDLWAAVVKLFVEEDDMVEAVADVTEQEVHHRALHQQFLGRAKLMSGAVELVEQVQVEGGMVLVEGGPGEGKTVFMAALADALRTGVKSKRNLVCDVISYSAAASQSARSVGNLLCCVIQWFRKMNVAEKESPLPHSYKDLLSEFHSTLSDTKKNRPLVLLVDGVELIRDGPGQLSSDWIPRQLPQGVCLVVSVTSKTALLQTLAKRRRTVLFTLGQLTETDRKEIAQRGLDIFGKKLSTSAFANQLQTLIMKNGAGSPLYLHLACEDLRNFASFDKLKENLHSLPHSLKQLLQHSLNRLCCQYRDFPGLHWALAVFTVSTTALSKRDLYSLLNTCNDLFSRDGQMSWKEVLHLSRNPEGRVPMATFIRIMQSLQSLVGSSHCHSTDDLLALTNPVVKQAFEDFLLPAESDRTRAHVILAAHFWVGADPQGEDTFFHGEANSVLHLPSSLILSDQLELLHSLLSSYFFLYANVRNGLLHHLLETYDKKNVCATSIDFQDSMKDCHSFMQRYAPLLSSWPDLFIQQALNELPETSAHKWAQALVGNGGVQVVEWLNRESQTVQDPSLLVSTFSSEPTCLVLSVDGELMVVGTRQGRLHFIKTQTGQEVRSLVSSCDGISSCVFLNDGHLASTSFDGRIEIWDIKNSCRTALIDGHSHVITASDVTGDRKHFATVSLDLLLKVWSSSKGHVVAALPSSSPLNCANFDPKGHLLAAGCWDGNVIVWNWLQNKSLTSLRGHQRSVRSLCFSSSSSMLCSGSVSGEVRMWSVPTSTCVRCFQAHCGAIEALTFLDDGAMLLSAGSDHMLHLWSGELGRSVMTLKSDHDPPLKKSVFSDPAALCVAVSGDYASVGYHAKGIKLFSLDSGDMIWASSDLDVSILCLLWVVLDPEQTEPDLLVSGGSDNYLRCWKRKEVEGKMASLKMLRMFGVQLGTTLALAQNSTYLATASDDFTIALWLLSDLALDSSIEPHALLRGHSGGVTCLAFSPDGGQLLSGGKDQVLMLWDVSSSPAALSKSLLHSHRAWITGCVWTPDCVISASVDGRLCLWDLQSGQHYREISWRSPLTSVCCLGQYVVAGCAEGALHVWNWETSIEICHITAHKQRIHHCCLHPNTEEMTVFTASDDGTVRIWKPLLVEHLNSFRGHSGAVRGIVHKGGEFLTVSEDCSLRCWTRTTKSPLSLRGPVTALCFSQKDGLALAGYESGFLELWQNNRVIGHKQASDSPITVICSMPDSQLAVGYMQWGVDVWKLVWNHQHSNARLVKVTTYTTTQQLVHLTYCSVLIGVSETGNIFDVSKNDEDSENYTVSRWVQRARVLDVIHNDEKSLWLLGICDDIYEKRKIQIGFLFAMGPENESAFSENTVHIDEEMKNSIMTAATVDKDFVVCGDVNGNVWFNHPPEVSLWKNIRMAHSDRISVLKITDSTIISASYDRTVKLWDRTTKKRVGMFACAGPVLVLDVNPQKPTELLCGDGQGKIYFLSWRQFREGL